MRTKNEISIKEMHVLYVEDEDMLREEVGAYLKRRVGTLYLAADGLEALTLLNQYPMDVVITDLIMPNMDGMKLTKAIREKFPLLPVVITTAINDVSVMQHTIEHGINRYLIKPFEPTVLVEALHILCEKYNQLKSGTQAIFDIPQQAVIANLETQLAKLLKQSSGKGPDKVSVFLHANLLEVVIKGSRTKLEKTVLSQQENHRMIDFLRETYYRQQVTEMKTLIKQTLNQHATLHQVVCRSHEDFDVIKWILD